MKAGERKKHSRSSRCEKISMQSPVIFITYFLAFLELGRVAKAASSNERDVDIEHGALGGVHTHFRAAEYLPQSLSAPNAGYKGKRAQAVKAEAAQFVAVANRYTKETARQVIESFDVAAFVPPSSFICVGDAHDAVQAEKLEDIRFVGLLNSTLKLDAFLRQVYSNQQSPDSLRHGLSSAIHYDPGSRLNSSSADELVTLHVSLPPKLGTRSHADGEQSAVEAFKDIRHENGVVIAHADGRSASLSLEIQLLKLTSVVHTLMYKSWVHFVQLHMPLQTLNTYTVGISQGASSSPKGTPVWNAGFTGKGEIAGMGDTGVDTSNCYFSKPDNKVIYNDLADKVDSNGHGTHVAGTMVGNAGDQGNEQGAAKDARMSFVDLQEYEKGDDSGALELPSSDTQNLKEDYLDLLYRDGARVSAHSFGACNSRLYCGYNKFSQDFDWFAWERQDALPVVAAGNEFSISRVLSPGNAKNALAVGATLSPRSSAESDEVVSLARKTGNNVLNLFLSLPPLPIISVVDVGKIAQMQSFSDAGLVDGSNFGIESIVINDSPQECVYRSDGLADKIVVGNGFCDGMSTLAKKAANASAKAYIHVPSASNWFELTSAPRTHFEETGLGNVGIPVGYAAYNPGRELLYSLIENMTSIIGSFQVRSFDTSRLWESFLAEYSSLGPVLNDAGALPRIKPDVVAPGDQIRSAKAGTECGTTSARGTSMATPSVAGAAVLARQYLRKQIGVSNPSGSLIAAVMINSAEPMLGYASVPLQNDVHLYPIQQKKSIEVGHGLVNLRRSLGGGPIADSPTEMIVVNNHNLTETGDMFQMCLGVSSGEELRISMHYFDHPSSLVQGEMTSQYINWLQMTVAESRGKWFWPRVRSLSNDERLRVPEPEDGYVQVNVTADRLVLPQQFSLVMTGNIQNVQNLSVCSYNDESLRVERTGYSPSPVFERFNFKKGKVVQDDPDERSSCDGIVQIVPAIMISLLLL